MEYICYAIIPIMVNIFVIWFAYQMMMHESKWFVIPLIGFSAILGAMIYALVN